MFWTHWRTLASIACLVLSVTACGTAPEPPVDDGGRAGVLTPPEAPEEPLLELSYQGGIIANPDPIPFVRVYSGGRVLVHYPAYMKKAGDYSMQLDEDELNALMESFSTEGMLTLEEGDLALMADQIQAELPQPRADDHGVQSVVRIRGESFTPEGSTSPMMFNVDQTIRAPSNLLSAAPDTSFTRLKSLASGVGALETLARSEALEKID